MEDLQPNEVRLSRKGSTRVPVIRSSYRGTWRGRGRGPPPYHVSAGSSPSRAPLPRTSAPNPSAYHAPHRPLPLTSSEAHARSRHPFGQPLHHFEPTIQHGTPQERAKASKSYRSRTEHQQALRPSSGSMEGKPERVDLTVALPPPCQKGVPGSHKAREKWMSEQKQRFLCERGLLVIGFKYLDLEKSILFLCKVQGPVKHAVDWIEDCTGPQQATHVRAATPDGISRSQQGIDPPVPQINRKHGDKPTIAKFSSLREPEARSAGPEISALEDACLTPPDPTSTHKSSEPYTTPFHPDLYDQDHHIPEHVSKKPPSIPSICAVEIIDFTDESCNSLSGPLSRWNAFCSGTLDVPLLPSNRTTTSQPSPPPEYPNRPLCSPVSENVEDHSGATCATVSDVQRYNAIVALDAGSGHRPAAVEDRQASPHPSSAAFSFVNERFRLLQRLYDRPRRILHPGGLSLIAVTMHGFIDRIYQSGTSKHGHTIWSPDLPTQEFVDDACMVYSGHGVPAIVLAHAREDAQLTYLSMEGDGVLQRRTLHRNWNKAKKAGISALTTMLRPLQFASGGYDHRVHIWTMEENLTNASSVELAIRHTSMVHSLLAIRDTSHKLISAGADRNIHLLDLSSERIVRTIKISNFPHNVYRTESPFCTLIEVAHLDLQFELHDHRMQPERPAQRFGYVTQEPQGRYMKGDTWSHYFASGDRAGQVRIWDLRNVSEEPYICFDDQVIQVIKTESYILACSKKNEYGVINVHDG